MKKAISLARISDTKQTDNSLASQHAGIRRTATERGISVVLELTEQSSGRTFRDTVEEAYEYCLSNFDRKRKRSFVDYILIYDWSRWFRNSAISGYWTHRFRTIGVEVNAVSRWIDYHDEADVVIHAVEQAMAQTESMKISRHTRRGQYYRIASGYYTYQVPKGIARHGQPKGETYLALDGESGHAYRSAFQRIAAGAIPAQVWREFGKALLGSRTQFYDNLQNPIYAGRYYLEASLPGQTSKWVELHCRESVTDWATFQAVQDRLTASDSPVVIDDLFPAKGVLFCPDCGGHVTSERSRGRSATYHYYRCGCNSKHFRVRAERIDQLLARVVQDISISPNAARYLRDQAADRLRAQRNTFAQSVGQLHKQLEAAQTRATSALNMYVDGKIGEAEYNAIKTAVQEIEAQITRLEWRKENTEDTQRKVFRLVETIGDLYPSLSGDKRNLFLQMVFPAGFTVAVQNPNDTIEACRTARINNIFSLIGCKTALYDSIKIETGLPVTENPALGPIPDADRTLLQRFLNRVAI